MWWLWSKSTAVVAHAISNDLVAAVARRVRQTRNERLTLSAVQYHALDPTALVARLDGLNGRQTDCAVVVAPDDPAVARAIDAATRRGVAVITLVSVLPLLAEFPALSSTKAPGLFCPLNLPT